MFAAESAAVTRALGFNVVAIHHIGSTAIPPIHAKPVIDMLVEVLDHGETDGCNAAMEALGYEPRGEFGIPGRRFFRKNDASGVRTHHIHAFVAGSPEIGRHLAFRDFMRAHPEHAAQYSMLKQKLAAAHSHDIEAYMDGKDAFIKETDRKAALWRSA